MPGTRKKAYCAICDFWYQSGKFEEHRDSKLHQTVLRDRRKMAKWYQVNGS